MCDGVRYCDQHQGSTTTESSSLDGGTRRMKDDFRGIFRGAFMTEPMIGVDGRCEVWNALRWQVSTQEERIRPTSIIINPRDCKHPSVDRESESIPRQANMPWVEYYVGMWKLHIYTVATESFNAYDSHGYRCNGWLILCMVCDV